MKKITLITTVVWVALIPGIGSASKPCLDLAIGVPPNRIGEGIINNDAKGQCVRLTSRNCRAITVGLWAKNVCYHDIWVRLSGTRGNRFFDINYRLGGKDVTGTIIRGNLNLVIEGHQVVDGRIRIKCARGNVRAKRKLKKVLVRGYIVGDPKAGDTVKLKGKFL